MRILVTRPEPGASETASALEAMGHDAVIAPLLAYKATGVAIELSGVQALAATSAEGIRVFAKSSARRDLPIYTVGDASASAARRSAFNDVRSAAGDATALARLLANLDPRRGAVLHLAGRDVARRLAVKGLEIRAPVLYEAETAGAFAKPVAEALSAGEIGAVALFSARTARIFAKLMREKHLAPRSLIALCLSDAVARALNGLCPVRIAERPTQSALLALIDQRGAPAAR